MAYDMAIEFIPDSGVEIKKDSTAPLDAPFFLNDMAVGITPHEHRGRGIPNKAAKSTDRKPGLPSCFAIRSLSINAWINPATKIPKRMYRAALSNVLHISFNKPNIIFM
jgi:hypothetical protein